MHILLIYLTNLSYRYNKKELTNLEIQEQTASLGNTCQKVILEGIKKDN